MECIYNSCAHEPIETYYFATYKRAHVDLTSTYTNKIIEPEHIMFYEKSYYCAELYPSTYEIYANDCDGLYNQFTRNELTLRKNESLIDINNVKIVVMAQYPNMVGEINEIDAYQYIQDNSMSYKWNGNSMVLHAKWCEYDDNTMESRI